MIVEKNRFLLGKKGTELQRKKQICSFYLCVGRFLSVLFLPVFFKWILNQPEDDNDSGNI